MTERKSVVLNGYGGYDKLTVEWKPAMEPNPGQVKIKIESCGMNFADIYTRYGLFKTPETPSPPCIMGREAAGQIEKIGEGVQQFKVGDRVAIISHKLGLWTESACVDVKDCILIPDEMNFDDAAAFYVNYVTAYLSVLNFGNLKPKDTIFIHSVVGGVGWAATQIAKTVSDVTVIGTASSWKHTVAKSNGVDFPISSTQSNYIDEVLSHFPQGVDIVLDNRSGADFIQERRMLSQMGKIIHLGVGSIVQGEHQSLWKLLRTWWGLKNISVVDLIMSNHAVCGLSLDVLKDKCPLRYSEAIVAVNELYKAGNIKPRIDSVWAFDKVREATAHLTSRKSIGKIILKP